MSAMGILRKLPSHGANAHHTVHGRPGAHISRTNVSYVTAGRASLGAHPAQAIPQHSRVVLHLSNMFAAAQPAYPDAKAHEQYQARHSAVLQSMACAKRRNASQRTDAND